MLTNEEIIKIRKGIRENPVKSIERLFQCKLWEKQQEIVNSVLLWKNKITAVRSCHDSGKSFDAARIALMYLIGNVDSLVITTAPSWTQVREILWREIRASYGKLEGSNELMTIGGNLLETKLNFGENWFAIGLATRKEGEASEVAERMLGFHSPTGKILVIADEGSGIEEPIWGAVDGLLTSANAQLLTTGNPYRKVGSFAKFFKTKGVYKIHIADINIPNVQENKVIIPGLMSPTYPQEMEAKYGKESNLYLIKVKGEFPKAEADTLISVDDIEKAFSREVKPDEEKILGVDVARYGDDFTVLLVRQGKKVLRKKAYSKESEMETAARVLRMMEEEGIEAVNVNIDDTGVGGGVVDRLQEKGYNVNGVIVGALADDEEHFANIRAENYWAIREWIKDCDLPNDDDFYELTNMKYKWKSEKKGQLLMEPKKDMKKRIGHSPDTADALMLTFKGTHPSPFPEQGKKTVKGMKFIDLAGDEEEVEITEEGDGRPDTAGLYDKEF